jgi:hypothetical protein
MNLNNCFTVIDSLASDTGTKPAFARHCTYVLNAAKVRAQVRAAYLLNLRDLRGTCFELRGKNGLENRQPRG